MTRNHPGSTAQRRRLLAVRLGTVAACLSLGACAQMGDLGLGLGNAGVPKEPEAIVGQAPASELQKATAYWGKEVAKNPRDSKAALNYARNLKALGRKQEALAVLQAGYIYNGDNAEYLSEYGRLALDQGQVSAASQLLERADDPARPDWRIVSARGVALAKQGQYKEAIPFFERARELAPAQSSILNNLAMAYTMDGQAEQAEELLRKATEAGAGDPRIKQNLAMVLGLQGKTDEARQITRAEDGEAPPSAPAPAGAGEPPAAGSAVAGRTETEPVAAAAGPPMDPDAIIRAALEAEAAKTKAAESAAKPAGKRKTKVASGDGEAPSLRPSR